MKTMTDMPMPVAEVATRRAFFAIDTRPHAAFTGMPSAVCSSWSHTINAVANASATKGLKAYGTRWLGDSST